MNKRYMDKKYLNKVIKLLNRMKNIQIQVKLRQNNLVIEMKIFMECKHSLGLFLIKMPIIFILKHIIK